MNQSVEVRVGRICSIADPDQTGFVTKKYLIDHLTAFAREDTPFISEFIHSRPETDQQSVFIWDFADCVLNYMKTTGSLRRVESGERAIVSKFVERSERLAKKRQEKVNAQQTARDLEEVKPCSFKPIILVKPSFEEIKPRYLNAVPGKPIGPESELSSEQKVHSAFADQLREYPKGEAYYGVSGVALTPFVLARLDEAESFFDTHTLAMQALRTQYFHQQQAGS